LKKAEGNIEGLDDENCVASFLEWRRGAEGIRAEGRKMKAGREKAGFHLPFWWVVDGDGDPRVRRLNREIYEGERHVITRRGDNPLSTSALIV